MPNNGIRIVVITVITVIFLLANIYGFLEILSYYRSLQEKQVLEWQNRNRVSSSTTTTTTSSPVEHVTSTTSRPVISTTTNIPETTWNNPTTIKIHHHHQHHQHHHHRTHPPPTTTTTTTETPTTTSTTTRIIITTPEVQTTTLAAQVFERIRIPATSTYRDQYLRKLESTTMTTTSSMSPSTTHHHHHHHHHIDVHRKDHTTTQAPTTTPRHHHHHHHHHHQHTTTTTSRPSHHGYRAEVRHSSWSQQPSSTMATPTRSDGYWKFPQGSIRAGISRGDPTTSTRSTTTERTTTTTTTTTRSENDVEYDPMSFEVEVIEQEEGEEEATTLPTTTTTMYVEPGRQRQPEPTRPPEISEERNVTIVTGLINIGRGDWNVYRRPLEKYHEFMENLLSLKNNMVIFTDESSYDFVEKYRKDHGLQEMTRVYKISIQDLPLYGYFKEAKMIIDAELSNDTFYNTIADSDMKTHPEAKSAEYNIVVNSKTYFLNNVTIENPFDSEHFVWLDAGYGHGNQSVFPYNNIWRPKFLDRKISLIKLTPHYDKLTNYNLNNLYRKNWAVLSGGFIAGDKHSIGQLHTIIHRRFVQLIYQKVVDDDQTLLVLAVNAYPHLFNIVLGDWFDAFKLFSVDAEQQLG